MNEGRKYSINDLLTMGSAHSNVTGPSPQISEETFADLSSTASELQKALRPKPRDFRVKLPSVDINNTTPLSFARALRDINNGLPWEKITCHNIDDAFKAVLRLQSLNLRDEPTTQQGNPVDLEAALRRVGLSLLCFWTS